MKDQDVVPAVLEHFQTAEKRFAIGQQVGDDDDQAAMRRVFRDLAEDAFDIRFGLRLGDVHGVDERVDVRLRRCARARFGGRPSRTP